MPTKKELQVLIIERDRLTDAIQTLEEKHKSGGVSKEDYRFLRERYEGKLKAIEQKLGMTKVEAKRVREREKVARPLRRPERAPPRREGAPLLGWFGITSPFNFLGFAGFIGGILVLVSILFPWVTFSAPGIALSASGADFITRAGFFSVISIAAFLTILGGFLAVWGGFNVMRSKEWMEGGFMLPTGGVLSFLGGGLIALQLSDAITTVTGYYGAALEALGASLNIGLGIYMCIIGAILALIGMFGIGH